MKGFLSFALVLAMMVCLLWFGIANQQNSFELEKTTNELIKAEQANKEKTVLENNFDKIAKTKLEEQLDKGNFNVQIAQNEINSALAQYLKGKASAYTILRQKLGDATTQFLNENTSVQILKGEGVVYAEYVYSSSMMKNTIVSAKLGNKIITYFEVPIGYTIRELVA